MATMIEAVVEALAPPNGKSKAEAAEKAIDALRAECGQWRALGYEIPEKQKVKVRAKIVAGSFRMHASVVMAKGWE